MKRVLLMTLVLFAFLIPLFAGQRVARYKKHSTAYWHKKVVAGADSSFSAETTTATLYGASDSAYTETFENMGDDFSVTVVTYGGGVTKSYYIDVLGANKGSLAAEAVPDSHFVPLYSLDFDAPQFVDSMSVATVSTSIDTIGTFFTIVPPLKADLIKFLYRTSATHTGNTVGAIYISR